MSTVRELAKLRDSEQLQKVIIEIEKHSKIPRKSTDIIGPVESDPEYQLIVEANNMAVDIDNEIGILELKQLHILSLQSKLQIVYTHVKTISSYYT